MIEIYMNPDEGTFGVHFKKNHAVVRWIDLRPNERKKVLRHLTYITTILKNEK